MKFGTNEITGAYLGSNNIDKIYCGTNLVFYKTTNANNDPNLNIDANTLACLHFNNNLNDSSQYASTRTEFSSVDYENYVTYTNSKEGFGKAINRFYYNASTAMQYRNSAFSSSETEELTLDFWLDGTKPSTTSYIQAAPGITKRGEGSTPWIGLEISANKNGFLFYLRHGSGSALDISSNLNTNFNLNSWNHIAICWKYNNFIKIYVNGIESYSASTSISFMSGVSGYNIYNVSENGNIAMDEFRLSNIIRWIGNFTPPMKPYN